MTTTSAIQTAHEQLLNEKSVTFHVNAPRFAKYDQYFPGQYTENLRISKALATQCIANTTPKVHHLAEFFFQSLDGTIHSISRDELDQFKMLAQKSDDWAWEPKYALTIRNTTGDQFTALMPYDTAPGYDCDNGITVAKRPTAFVASLASMTVIDQINGLVTPIFL